MSPKQVALSSLASVAGVFCALLVGCSSSGDTGGGGTGGDVAFHAEADVLPGFSYDTGPRPSAASPAQVSLKLSAAGARIVETTGSVSAGKLTGKAGAGTYKLDMHVKMEGHLKVDAGTVHFDGDLPGVKNVDIPVVGSAAFDGFLLDGDPALVTAGIPETKLPDIPLGTVPGHLSLTVVAGSQITSSFHGGCVSTHGGEATFAGTTETQGTIILKGSIVLDIPLFSKTFDLAPLTVTVPKSTKSIASSAVAASGAADGTNGTCGDAADGGAPGADGGNLDPNVLPGQTDSGTNDAAATGSVAAVTVDGSVMEAHVTSVQSSADGTVSAYVAVEGPGVRAGSTFLVSGKAAGSGCASGGSVLFLDSNGAGVSRALSPATDGGGCGLTITKAPSGAGGPFTGSFSGYVTDSTYAVMRRIEATFDVIE